MKVKMLTPMINKTEEAAIDFDREPAIVDTERFEKQIILSEIGEEGQRKLKNAHVAVIGAGGIGCPALTYLASSGVGFITVIDDDNITISNLPRQTLYALENVGINKALVASETLCMRHPNTVFRPVTHRFDSELQNLILNKIDLVLDCTDNHLTKYILSDICKKKGIPFLSCAALGWEGYIGGYSAGAPSYREVFPEAPQDFRNCDQAGVIASAPGMFGVLAAAEAIKIILSVGKSVIGRLYRYNLLDGRFSEMVFDQSAGEDRNHSANITPFYYLDADEAREEWEVIDVREETEFAAQPPLENAYKIPMREILKDPKAALSNFQSPLFICAAGRRAERTALTAYLSGGFKKIGSLRGGYKKISNFSQP